MQHHVVNEVENFNSIVSAKVDDIIKTVQAGGPYMLPHDVYQNARDYLNSGGDYEGAELARRNLEDIVGSELVKSIQSEVGSVLSSATPEQKTTFLGLLVHQDKVNEPSGGSKVGRWTIKQFIEHVIPYVGSVASAVLLDGPTNASKAHDNTINQINASIPPEK
jgi:hypothetical protein